METAPHARELEASRGWTWITQAFELFKKAPGNWIAAFLVWCLLYVVVSLVPGGGLLTTLFGEVLIAGWLLGCRSLDTGGEFKIEHLFAAFKSQHLTQLVIVGALYLAGMFAAFLVVGLLVGGPMLSLFWGKPNPDLTQLGFGFLIGCLLIVALLIPLMMATWFAPALVIFAGQPAFDAMKQSFEACMRNIVPFLVYGLIAFGLAIVAALPFGLGIIVLAPVIIASIYTSYRDVFDRFPEPAPAAAG